MTSPPADLRPCRPAMQMEVGQFSWKPLEHYFRTPQCELLYHRNWCKSMNSQKLWTKLFLVLRYVEKFYTALLSPFEGHFVTTDIFTSHFHLLFCSPYFHTQKGALTCYNFKFSCVNFECFKFTKLNKVYNKSIFSNFHTPDTHITFAQHPWGHLRYIPRTRS